MTKTVTAVAGIITNIENNHTLINNHMKGVNIFLADGFEDIEALGTYDVLCRGGVRPKLIGIGEDPFAATSHKVTIGVDNFFSEMEVSHAGTTVEDVMIFPGGMPGSRSLASCRQLIKAMKDHYAAGGSLAAICAAPGLVLSQLDDVKDLEFTCFDGFENALIEKGAKFNPIPAVRSGRIITGRSAGHALAFAMEILALVKDAETVEAVHHALYL